MVNVLSDLVVVLNIDVTCTKLKVFCLVMQVSFHTNLYFCPDNIITKLNLI